MRRLIRSKNDRKLAGVLGGLGKYLGVDSNLLRVIFVILLFPTGVMPLIVTYFVLTFLLPNEESEIH
ncbi:PspC domain-containing protein [Bacillus sp. RO1]|uniref:PspC domain-containing protein n=1 Tax=Bacillus sp. RO1 TaxID=2722703 RepID=UPI001456DF08|nr:PspC domain-containing protein [Bacillus sp. RO1]NLP51222.1 PspC domain-containing protein [Bacillus sp. RO1]